MELVKRQFNRYLPAWLAGGVSALLIASILRFPSSTTAAVGVNQQMNFQARLLNAQGATVPDGNYNIEFKIYQDGDGVLGGVDETLKWTETRLNNNSQGVVVKNGFFSVYLGSVTAFGSSIDWNQDTLWLSINIGNTNGTCTPFSGCSPDGEMTPFKRLSANPYALNSRQLGGLTSSQYVQLAQGVQTDSSTTSSSIFINKTGASANLLQLQRGGADVLVIDNAGLLSFKPQTDNISALRVTNAAGTSTVLNLDTVNRRVGIGTATPSADLHVVTGDSTGTTILLSTSPTTGNGLRVIAPSLTSGAAISVGGTLSTALTDFTGDLIRVNPARTLNAGAASVTDSGNFLDLTRSNTVNLSGQTFAITGDLAVLQSNCTQTLGTCTDNSNILELNQQYSAASGEVLNIINNGTGLALRVNDDGTFTDTTPFVIDASGFVGIGTTAPTARLTVRGVAGVNDPLADFGTSGATDSNSLRLTNGSGEFTWFIAGGPSTFMPGTATGDSGIRANITKKLFIGDSDKTRVVVDSSGNVGIGITAPTSLLHVVGSQPIAVATSGTAATQALQVTGGKGGNTTGTTGQVGGAGAAANITAGAGGDAPAGSTNGNGGSITIQGGAAGSGLGAAGTYGNLLLQTAGGNVGIGDATPAYLLTVGNGDLFGIDGAANTSLVWEGSGADAFETSLTVVNPTADITYRLADAAAGTYDLCSSVGNCLSGGGAATLQSAYNAGNTITTTDNRNILFTLNDTAPNSSFIVNMLGTGNVFQVQDTGASVFTIADGGATTVRPTTNSVTGFIVQSTGGTNVLTVDTINNIVKATGDGTPLVVQNTSGSPVLTVNAGGAGGVDPVTITGRGTTNTILRFNDDGANTAAVYTLNGENNLRLLGEGNVYIDGGGASNGDLTILSSGNVGIGTTAPSSLLHVAGSQPIAVATSGTAATQALQVTGGKGGNTTGTTGQVGGAGAAANITAGAGGDAPAGSTNGNGGSITLQGGAAGSGLGIAGTAGNILLAPTGGRVVAGDNSLTDLGNLGDVRLAVVAAQPASFGIVVNSSTVNDYGRFIFGGRSTNSITKALGSVEGGIEAAGTDTTIDGFVRLSTTLDGSTTEKVRITSAGEVGIGTTSPTTGSKLQVQGGRTRLLPTDEQYALGLSRTTASNGYYWVGVTAAATPDLVFSNNAGTERVRIQDDGDVGIGITDPLYRLQVISTGAGIRNITFANNQAAAADTGVGVRLAGPSDITMADVQGAWAGAATTDAYLAMRVRGSNALTERFRISSTGQLTLSFYNCTGTNGGALTAISGVISCSDDDAGAAGSTTLQQAYDASTSPAQILTSSAAKNIIFKSGVGFNSTTAFQVIPDGTTTPTFNVDTTNQRVGIGNSAPSTQLHVTGGARITGLGTCDTIDTDINGVLSCGIDAGAAATSLQAAYDSSTSPATITTSSVAKNIIFKSGAGFDSTSLFQIQNAAGTSLFNADTSNLKITVNQGYLAVTGFGTPATPAIAVGSNQGGSLSGASGTTYYYKVTALNAAGESLPSVESSIAATSFTAIAAPSTALTAADSGTAGNVSCDGTTGCVYQVTFTTANGETTVGPSSTALLNVASKIINLTSVPTGSTSTTSRKIYRSTNGGAFALAVTISDNTTTTTTDNLAAPSGAVPASNTARTNTNNATVTFTTISGATSYRIYRSTTSGSGYAYQTATSSPFTDTGAAGTSSAPPTSSSVERVGIGTSTPTHNLHVAGNALFKNAADSTTAFQVQNAAAGELFNIDSTNANITFNGLNTGELQSWSTNANALPAAREWHSSVVANGYVYVIGGYNAGGQSTVYYAKLNADGSAGSWSTNANALPAARFWHSSVVANGYVYVMGGSDTSSGVSTVLYAKLNADGSTGSWSTNANALPATMYDHSSVVANGYVYVIGGFNGSAQTTVYYAKLNADGSTGSWSTNANALPAARRSHSSVVANGYVYALGGWDSGVTQSTVYYAKLNANGSTGSWSTNANALPAARQDHSSVVVNGYVYALGGYNGSAAQSTVYYAKLNANGSTGSWSTNANALPATMYDHSSVVANGYVYAIGGSNGSTGQSTVYYASAARLKLGGSVDLVGLGGQTLNEQGATGGMLTAGNTSIIGTLDVREQANFSQSLNIGDSLTVNGNALFKNTTNSTTAFQVQNTAGSSLLNTDTTASILTQLNVTGVTYKGGADVAGSTNSGATFSTANSVAVSGRYAYLVKIGNATACSQSAGSAVGCELQVYDVSVPGSPTYVGGADASGSTNSGIDSSNFNDVTVSGRYAYVTKANSATACSQSAGSAIGCELQVYDISNPGSPTYIGGVDASGTANSGTGSDPLTSVTVSGRYAYVVKDADATSCSQSAGSAVGCELQIYDIANPASPTYVGGADSTGSTNSGVGNSTFNEVAVAGRYVYVAKALSATACSQTVGSAIGCELQVYDVANPASPSYIGGADASGSTNAGTDGAAFNDVAVSGRYAYIVKGGSGTTCSQTAGSAIGCELQVYDIANPASPSYVGGADVTGATNTGTGGQTQDAIAVAGRYAFVVRKNVSATACSQTVSGQGCELQVYDLNTPGSPTYVGGADASGSSNSGATSSNPLSAVASSGRYVYVINEGGTTTCSQTAGSALGCELQVYDASGIEASALLAHSLESGTLSVQNNANIFNDLTVGGGVTVGQSLEVLGDLASNGNALFRNQTNSTAAFAIQNAAGNSLFNADTANQRIGIGRVGGFSDSPTKLGDPVSLPASTANATAFSPDGTYMSVAHFISPFVTIYKRSGDTFTKLADPATLPASNGFGAAFSPDGTYLSIAHDVSPFVTIYKRSGDTFTKLADPASLPAGQGLGTSFSPDGTYLSIAHDVTPFVTIYKRSGDTFTKLANPASLPGATGFGTAFSADGVYLSVATAGSPFVTIYKRSGDTFTKLADPATLPAGGARGTAFSPDGTYLSIAHDVTPFVTIYKRSGDTFTKLANPATLPAGRGEGIAFSPDGIYLSVAHLNTPFVTIYKRSGDTFTKLANPATLPAGFGEGTFFSPDGTYLSLAHAITPFITIYKGTGGVTRTLEISTHSTAAEGLSFGKELTLYRSAPGVLTLASGGSLTIPTGTLSVGTSAGEASLHVAGTALFRNTSDSVAAFQVQSATGASVLSVDTSTGNVGVGTSTPSSLLHIASAVDAVLTIDADTDNVDENDNAQILFKQDGGTTTARVGFKTGTNDFEIINVQSTFAEIQLGTNNGADLTIDTAGNIGIGDTTPASLFTVGNGDLFQITSTGTLTSAVAHDQTWTITPSLTGGARLTDVFTISQADNATNDSTANLLQLTNSDTGSTVAALDINQVAGARGIQISGITTNNAILVSTSPTTGGALRVNGPTITSGQALIVDGAGSTTLSDFTGDYIKVAPTRTLNAGAASVTDSGNFLDLTRSNTINLSGQTFSVTGDLALLQSNCTQTLGTCTDASNILELNQQYAAASGAVLNVMGAGTGNLATLDATHTSANGVSIDVASNSTSQFALSVTSANGATQGLFVRADGRVGIGTTTLNARFNVTGSSAGGGPSLLRLTDSAGPTDVFDVSDTGKVTIKNTVDSTTEFVVQKTGTGVELFVIDSTNSRVYVGDTTADDVGVLLVLDTKTGSSDPDPASSINGGMYYNSGLGKFRCYENGGWKNCDETGSTEFLMCGPGNTALGLCHTFTNQGAGFIEVANGVSKTFADLTWYTQFRIVSVLSVTASTADIRIECDTDVAFASATTMGTLDNPAATINVGAWTAIPAGECKTTDGQYIRAGMVAGNGTEDPAVRYIRLEVR